jgi:hypothetical protein
MIATNHGAGVMPSTVHTVQHASHVLAGSLTSADAGLGAIFTIVYAAAAGFALLTLAVSLFMPDSPLRETTYFAPITD